MEQQLWGTMPDGRPVHIYTLTNENGMKIRVSDLGAHLLEVWVPDRAGQQRNVVLGYDTMEEYRNNTTCFGATIGRVANRTAGAAYWLNGKEATLAANEAPNNLHSGPDGYQLRLWKAEAEENSVAFSLHSPDGDQGHPGNLDLTVRYTLTETDKIRIDYEGFCDQDTVLAPTNHSYFNLNGEASGDVLGHRLQIFASRYTPVQGENGLPTGEVLPVLGTPMDFTSPKAIGEDIGRKDAQLICRHQGYDHNFALEDTDGHLAKAAVLESPESGIILTVSTDQPGIQVYTANYLHDEPGKNGGHYQAYAGVALETQQFPNAVNTPAFPSPVVPAKTPWHSTTVFAFTAAESNL